MPSRIMFTGVVSLLLTAAGTAPVRAGAVVAIDEEASVEAGYLLGRWQPWAGFAHWDSRHPDDRGTYDSYRVGMTCYIKGQNANLKAGFERATAAAPAAATGGDKRDAFVLACSVAY